MKLFLLLVISSIFSSAYSFEYFCEKDNEDSKVIISFERGEGNLKYIEKSVVIFDLKIPDSSIFFGNTWETDRKYISFNPGWGESTVNIYARVSEEAENSIFDIYATGMVTSGRPVIKHLRDYSCIRVFEVAKS